ncbi:hypothetical protein N0V85_004679 [Neurospora sp. IMI 360204]|nr:hypothetical protein N0V85_004679 [Neurospora sp. IMI 360204]
MDSFTKEISVESSGVLFAAIEMPIAGFIRPTDLKVDNKFINFDETPIPFEFLDDATYDTRGNDTINGKTD